MLTIILLVLLGTTYLLPATVEANKQVSNNISIARYHGDNLIISYKLSYPTIV